MYLSKSWRDARLSVAIFFVPIVFYVYSVMRYPGSSGVGLDAGSSHLGVEHVAAYLASFVGILLLFVAWSLGGDGVGHEIAEDRGAYLLTRPRNRRFFLWSDSGFAFGLMAVLSWATALLFGLVVHLGLVRLPHYGSPSPLFFLLVPLCGLVFAGLIYAVTYLCTMLIPRDKTARVISVAVLIAYAYLHYKAAHTWGGVTRYFFPTWWVDPFPYQYSSAVAPHVWLELGVRVIAIVVLLLIAQLVLERREIRA
jgi:ABC-type transport system involved in multi-copper enzyme maturation permease subunit